MSQRRTERLSKSKTARAKRARRASSVTLNDHDSAALALARRETKTAVANAEQADMRLREALDILPQGIVFLDADGRYILWNQQYSDIYKRSADLFRPGAKLARSARRWNRMDCIGPRCSTAISARPSIAGGAVTPAR